MNYTKNIGVISTLIIIVFSGIYTYLQIKKIKNLIQLNTNKIKKINITNNNNINKEICNLEHECNEYENTINKLNNLIDNESLSDIDDLQLNVNKFIQNEEKDILKNSSNIDNSKNNQDLYHIQKYNNSNVAYYNTNLSTLKIGTSFFLKTQITNQKLAVITQVPLYAIAPII